MRSRPSNELSLVLLAAAAGVLLSGCAVGFRVPASDVTTTTATLNGVVASTGTDDGEWFFRYGKSTTYGNETPHRPISFNDFTDVSEPVTGLDPGVTYHYATCAVDQQPGVGPLCSHDQAFRTISTATRDAVVVTGSAGLFSSIDIDVSSGSSGESPTGHAAADVSGLGRLQASAITCLSVSGANAVVAGTLEPNPGGYVGFRVAVKDDGPADSGLDLIGVQGLTGTAIECSSPRPTPDVISNGDVVVVDAP